MMVSKKQCLKAILYVLHVARVSKAKRNAAATINRDIQKWLKRLVSRLDADSRANYFSLVNSISTFLFLISSVYAS